MRDLIYLAQAINNVGPESKIKEYQEALPEKLDLRTVDISFFSFDVLKGKRIKFLQKTTKTLIQGNYYKLVNVKKEERQIWDWNTYSFYDGVVYKFQVINEKNRKIYVNSERFLDEIDDYE
jgi:hypothetical protein